MFARKEKNINLNSELFICKTNLGSRFVDSALTATIRISETEDNPIIKQEIRQHNTEDEIIFRLRNLEEHLGIDGVQESILSRLKVLEDKIMRIEEIYPQVATRVFKYEPDQVKGTGRLSKVPDLFTDNMPQASNSQSKKIEEIKQRLNELKGSSK